MKKFLNPHGNKLPTRLLVKPGEKFSGPAVGDGGGGFGACPGVVSLLEKGQC